MSLTILQLLGWARRCVNHFNDMNGGRLQGKKIALVYHNSAYGKEPIRTLREFLRKAWFDLTIAACGSSRPGTKVPVAANSS